MNNKKLHEAESAMRVYSNCCNDDVVLANMPKTNEVTNYFICKKCKEACDVHEESKLRNVVVGNILV